jgi:hypothetical protein
VSIDQVANGRATDEPSTDGAGELEVEERAAAPPRVEVPTVSGLYERDAVPGVRGREELRLDVDGRYPQMMASGVMRKPPAIKREWVATLTASGVDQWSGPIVFERSPGAQFPWLSAEVTITRDQDSDEPLARLRLIRADGSARVSTLGYRSPRFHPVDLEFDWERGEATTLELDTCDHPNRPGSLPCETLTVGQVFERAGFDVTTTAGGVVPKLRSGADRLWSDQEMHDAMQEYWTHSGGPAKWAIWVFFASLHEPFDGPPEDLGGIMFDTIGVKQRHGTAIFTDSFIASPPPNDPDPAAAVKRMLFWTTVHEMGHCFNLAHSWDKTFGRTWMPLRDEPEARTFMNYPFAVRGGQRAFFRDFKYRFSGQELRFMRHAPARFVKPGAAPWFDHHGFEAADDELDPGLVLSVRVNRERDVFEFMEPILVELKLENVSGEPQIVDDRLLRHAGSIRAVVKHDRREAREVVPYAQHCWKPRKVVLAPGESLYAPLLISAGQNGWDLADPGNYTVQVAVHHGGFDLVSNALRLRVSPPRSRDEEDVAGAFFTDEVGRTIAFTGSEFLEGANETLREVVDRLPDRRVALHANLALGNVEARDYKRLQLHRGRLELTARKRKPEGHERIKAALIERADEAAESFGHIGYRGAVERFSDLLVRQREGDEAVAALDTLHETLAGRTVRGREVRPEALAEIEERREAIASST